MNAVEAPAADTSEPPAKRVKVEVEVAEEKLEAPKADARTKVKGVALVKAE